MPKELAKFGWPQDVLINPPTDGRNIDRINKNIGREAYSFCTPIYLVNNGVDTLITYSFLIDPSWNFWLSNIICVGTTDGTKQDTAAVNGNLTITDGVDGNILFDNVPLVMFVAAPATTTGVAPSYRSSLPKPYCFRAGNTFSMQHQLVNYPFYLPTNHQIIFEGWRDFSYA